MTHPNLNTPAGTLVYYHPSSGHRSQENIHHTGVLVSVFEDNPNTYHQLKVIAFWPQGMGNHRPSTQCISDLRTYFKTHPSIIRRLKSQSRFDLHYTIARLRLMLEPNSPLRIHNVDVGWMPRDSCYIIRDVDYDVPISDKPRSLTQFLIRYTDAS